MLELIEGDIIRSDETTFKALAWMVRQLGITVDDSIKDYAMVQVVTTDNEVTVTEVKR